MGKNALRDNCLRPPTPAAPRRVCGRMSRKRREPAHRRRVSGESSGGIGDLGGRVAVRADAPHPSHRKSHRARRYVLPALLVLLLVLIGVGAGYQWSRPVPTPVFHAALSDSVQLPGTSPSLPWPTVGSAALTMEGVGSLGKVGSDQPVPIASITKVMTAYVVLQDHPLTAGATGPAIPVDAATVAAYQSGLATQQSVVQVQAGESLTQLEALQGLLIPSGNDLAVLLADWDAGGTDAFIAKMNATAQKLGLTSTHFVDVSGLDPGSVSTATDLITLGQAAMALPAFAAVVDMTQATLPVAGVVLNFDYALGHDGIIGIKTGTDAAAGGCLLFEAQSTVDGQKETLVGAVLGQRGSSPIDAVVSASEALTQAAFAAMTSVPIVPQGQLLGRVVAKWGSSVKVDALDAPTIVAWPGLTVPAHFHVGTLSSGVAADTRIGELTVDLDGGNVDVPMRVAAPLKGPSAMWRLTRR
jgi:serine-type D-Ala-D-Ala carboxypeptidase (penicillin-binding protein 5/6)